MAAQSVLLMDIGGKAFGRRFEGVLHLEVAFDAGIFLSAKKSG
jgi:hypothetical protein